MQTKDEARAYNLPDLLNAIDKNSIEWSLFYFGIERDPENYRIERKERRETRRIGADRVPKKGDILACNINDYFELQHEDFRKAYPELSAEGNSGVVERVEDVIPHGDKAEIVIGRYVIREK